MRTRRTKAQISNDNYNKEVDLYKWYIINPIEKKAIAGFEFKGDAIEYLQDYDEYCKVVAKSSLKKFGIEIPNEKWKNKLLNAPVEKNIKPDANYYINLENLIQKLEVNKMRVEESIKSNLWHDGYLVNLQQAFKMYKSQILDLKKKLKKQSSINKSKPMNAPAKKPTAKQLEARKRFAEMAKNGTLAKKRAASLNAPAKRKKVISARTICRRVIDVPGINKRTGQLLKGWHYVNGKPAKVTAKKKPAAIKKAVAKKKPATKKPVAKKKFLGIF
jgi:hypothetical protein